MFIQSFITIETLSLCVFAQCGAGACIISEIIWCQLCTYAVFVCLDTQSVCVLCRDWKLFV